MRGLQGTASVLFTAAVVLLVGWLTYEQLAKPIPHVADLDGGADGGAVVASSGGGAATDAGAAADAGLTTPTPVESGDGGLSLTFLTDSGALPTGAPRTVKLGVVLVQWTGAEGATGSARARPEALKRARELAEQARTDFKAAVKAGDTGSSEDIGRMPRGVLEAPVEAVVFSLAAGDLSEPLETPRGYWVVKRLE
ncbi:MAG: Peptidyl-prolyl cis-trans isomerase PpiD [Labilithrix sp.]|nr:Peptidyl-prolyl cis-trans isomerase PpiD [Labilithrix sp.]